MLASFGAATELSRREQVASALGGKGIALGDLGRSAEAIATYDDLLARLGAATELPLREQVARALVRKAIELGALGRSVEAIAVCDDVLARFGAATELPLREIAVKARIYKVGLDPTVLSPGAIWKLSAIGASAAVFISPKLYRAWSCGP